MFLSWGYRSYDFNYLFDSGILRSRGVWGNALERESSGESSYFRYRGSLESFEYYGESEEKEVDDVK